MNKPKRKELKAQIEELQVALAVEVRRGKMVHDAMQVWKREAVAREQYLTDKLRKALAEHHKVGAQEKL